MFIPTNKLRFYGTKLIEKMSPELPEHFPKLGALLPRNNLCCTCVAAESVLGSLREYIYQLFCVLSLVSVCNR